MSQVQNSSQHSSQQRLWWSIGQKVVLGTPFIIHQPGHVTSLKLRPGDIVEYLGKEISEHKVTHKLYWEGVTFDVSGFALERILKDGSRLSPTISH